MPTERVQYLVQRFFENTITPAEMEELAAWVQATDNDEPLKELLKNAWEQHQPTMLMPDDMNRRLLIGMFKSEIPQRPIHRVHFMRRFGRWAAAAAVLIMISAAGWWFLTNKEKPTQPIVQHTDTIIKPGTDGAILTLADGSTVVLDSLQNGVITTQGNTAVQIENGQLVYHADKNAGPVIFNNMTTPKGRQFRLVLPDGTTVWLNAASSITYPTAFAGHERKVSITGEAYFEVAHNKEAPFKVNVNGKSEVEVLGTHFNINAYGDDAATKTTLLEGKVKVSAISNRQSAILKAGEQASVSQTSQLSQPIPVQTEEVMAWKNGLFFFRNAGLQEVMNQLERWYDIDVKYKGTIPAFSINGKMDRGLNLQEVLDFLAKLEVKYTLTGRTITVLGN